MLGFILQHHGLHMGLDEYWKLRSVVCRALLDGCYCKLPNQVCHKWIQTGHSPTDNIAVKKSRQISLFLTSGFYCVSILLDQHVCILQFSKFWILQFDFPRLSKYNLIWLVVLTILKNMKVIGDHYSQLNGKS